MHTLLCLVSLSGLWGLFLLCFIVSISTRMGKNTQVLGVSRRKPYRGCPVSNSSGSQTTGSRWKLTEGQKEDAREHFCGCSGPRAWVTRVLVVCAAGRPASTCHHELWEHDSMSDQRQTPRSAAFESEVMERGLGLRGRNWVVRSSIRSSHSYLV